jgi:hypothetical protein
MYAKTPAKITAIFFIKAGILNHLFKSMYRIILDKNQK